MIVLLTVLTVAEITRMSAAATATAKCSAPSVFSHRGYRSAGLENTLTAFGRALETGSARIEFDVRFTKDHHPMLMHDATVDRTTTGTGHVAAMTTSGGAEPTPTPSQSMVTDHPAPTRPATGRQPAPTPRSASAQTCTPAGGSAADDR